VPTGAARSPRTSYVTAATGALVIVLDAALGLGGLGGSLFVLLGVTAAASTTRALRRYRPGLRWPWIASCAAMVLWVLGGAAREVTGSLGDLTSDRALLPDLLTAPGYLLFALGIWGIARARRHGIAGEVDAVLDGMLAALGGLVAAWVYLIEPALVQEHSPLRVRLVLAAYPLLSILVTGLVARLAFSPSARRTPAFGFLVVACTLLLVGDVLYMLAESGAVALPRAIVDLPYALAFLGYSTAVLHPSMRSLSLRVEAREAAPRRGRMATIAVALAVPVLVTLAPVPHGADTQVTGGLVLLLAVLAGVRVYRALRSHARAEVRLARQATHDALTGLPNRILVREHIEAALSSSDPRLALVFLDVDRFKLVNDTYGHSVGDELLVAVGERLRGVVRPSDVVARIGGDEFVVVLHHLDERTAIEAAERLRSAFEAPFVVRGELVHTTASFGVAIADGIHETGAEALIANADTAMYWAKDSGRDGVSAFDRAMRDQVAARLTIENALRDAVERDQLRLHYQPVVDLDGRRVSGVEALLRWEHPSLGLVSPVTFIPIAEDSGAIVPIGAWVIEEACRQLAAWRRDGMDLDVAVNVSARQLRDPGLVPTIRRCLETEDLPASALVVELTESALIDDPGKASEVLQEVRALGVRVSIDDFGTGYSSLGYLRQFPVDCVKIDRSFVEHVDDAGSADVPLVSAILAMSGALELRTVAEGIERDEQVAVLRQLGCRWGQGYLFSKPTTADLLPAAVAAIEGTRV
jgi:diguanylate cyclase